MNRNVGSFRGSYSPGGLNSTALRLERCRRAGRRSGVVRRQLCELRGPGRQQRVRQVGAEEFEQLYHAMCEREGRPFDRRGLNTHHAYYVALVTRYRVQGNGFETTNAQSCAAMAARGRPRCRRTVQRLRKGLAAMGLLDFHHVKRSGRERRPGELDSLRVVCLHLRRAGADVTLRSWSEPALKGRRLRRETLSPPPSAADDVGDRSAVQGSIDGRDASWGLQLEVTRYMSEDERRLAYLELCETHAPTFIGPAQRAELARLRAALGSSGHSTLSADSIAADGER